MKFGALPVSEAEGAILAHGLKAEDRMFKKGRVLDRRDVDDLLAAGIAEIIAARLEEGDVGENEAARKIAEAVTGQGVSRGQPFTGRVNLFARDHGVAVVDADGVKKLNAVDEAATLATLAPFSVAAAKQLVATVKIIPFAVACGVLARCVDCARAEQGLLQIAPFVPHAVGLVQTALPGTRSSVLDKTATITRGRLESLGSHLEAEVRCPHTVEDLCRALESLAVRRCAPILVVGASAITDRRDVIPAAIERAGGRVEHFGMPVDPGNLLLLGTDGRGIAVIGLPGCARSPKLNGIDWVLQRLLAGLEVTGADLAAMGAGGLLSEITARPQPRAAADSDSGDRRRRSKTRVAAIVLAAGRSSRMEGVNKMLAAIDGKPMVTRVADAALASKARPVIVVVGHEADQVGAALAGRDLTIVRNPDFESGLSASLRRGLSALPDGIDGAVVCLGDMPRIGAETIDRLIAAFDPEGRSAICVPAFKGKQGNPVLWARRFFPEIMEIAGDVGARHLIGAYADQVRHVEMLTDDVLFDVDTPGGLDAASSANTGRT
ncbi:MAG: molybdopterin-binding/glycosyltransferase family 2 protein [Rhodospirillales bacterium]|jgi:molybdenum cofactor cytidylyltransferase|nr:molybdopterin-binding/glycosyltransferase family 2 protein [Rhodospirillales bacterium]